MSRETTPKILLKHLINPGSLQKGPYVDQLEQALGQYFGQVAFPVNSGRSAIYLALKTLGIGAGDEVLLQAYTCNAVPNPILWTGATPVYVDIEEKSLNMDPSDLKKKITAKAKAIIVQHTFGNPAPIKEILKIADEHKLKVIEDCAHSLGATVDNKLLGTYGDLAILSFGREKVISSLTGGALIVNDNNLIDKIETKISALPSLSLVKIFQEIFNYFAWRLLFRKIYLKEGGSNFVKHLYQFDFINVITSQKELSGLNPGWYPSAMPNVFAHIALNELNNVESSNQKRIEMAQKYQDKLAGSNFKVLTQESGIYLRIVVLHPKAKLILEKAKEQKLIFGNWYNNVIYPDSVHLSKLGYTSGSCPVAENLAHQSLNLPNYMGITESEIDQTVAFLKGFN